MNEEMTWDDLSYYSQSEQALGLSQETMLQYQVDADTQKNSWMTAFSSQYHQYRIPFPSTSHVDS